MRIHFGKLITYVVVFAGILGISYNLIDISAVPFLDKTQFSFDLPNKTIFIAGLAIFFLLDLLYVSFPPIFTILAVIVLSTSITSNYGLGILFGLVTYVLLRTIGKAVGRKT